MPMTITFTEFNFNEPKMLEAVLTYLKKQSDCCANATVHCFERDKEGWLEWGIRLNYANGGGIFVGAIQRKTADDQVELHS